MRKKYFKRAKDIMGDIKFFYFNFEKLIQSKILSTNVKIIQI